MRGLRFWKLHGAGNDFVLIDDRAGEVEDPPQLATEICRRRFGVGADGLIVVTAVEGDSVRIAYHNADGSRAEFCGNGARCAARFAFDRGIAPSDMELRFGEIGVRAVVERDEVCISLERPRLLGEVPLRIDETGQELVALHVAAGVPHLVVLAPASEQNPPFDALRASVDEGVPVPVREANITRVVEVGSQMLEVSTLERGSGETLACGSGALAAAEAVAAGAAEARFTVMPPARRPLEVRLGPGPSEASLSGEAVVVYSGTLA